MVVLILARAILSTAALSAVTVWEAYRGRLDTARADGILKKWSRGLLDGARVELDVRGLDHIEPGATYVVMSNHQSLYDIPVLLHALPLSLRMVAKAELFRVPLWAQAMRKAGFLPVHRGDPAKALEDMKAAQKALRNGLSIWVAPEGTRSPDGQLLPFKRGGFHLAAAVKAKILPVTIDGSRQVLSARSLRIVTGRKVVVTVGCPIATAKSSRKDREQLLNATRESIAAPLFPAT